MKILAADTATESASVAIVSEGEVLAETNLSHRQTHTIRLMPMIDAILEEAGLSLSDMDGFAATAGPGSFTGLRIGLATIKGLAFSAEKPVAGVSTFEALAYPLIFSGMRVCAMVDARKGEVYTAQYDTADGSLRQIRGSEAVSPEKAARQTDASFLFVGNGARIYSDRIRSIIGESARFAPSCHMQIRAASVGMLGLETIMQAPSDSLPSLLPRYIRASDAENLRSAARKS